MSNAFHFKERWSCVGRQGNDHKFPPTLPPLPQTKNIVIIVKKKKKKKKKDCERCINNPELTKKT